MTRPRTLGDDCAFKDDFAAADDKNTASWWEFDSHSHGDFDLREEFKSGIPARLG